METQTITLTRRSASGRRNHLRPRARMGLVTFVVPAKNEESGIGATLRALPTATMRAFGYVCETVVLDGQSTDRTAEIARAWGATVVTDREKGKGSAVRNGRSHLHGDYVIMLDGDGTYATDALARVVAALDAGAEVVMGRRRPEPGAMSGLHGIGNRILSLAARILYFGRCPDLCTGLWGFRAEALERMPLRSKKFGLEAELYALSRRLGLRMAFVDVAYLARGGASKLDTLRDGWRIVRRLLVTRFIRVQPRAAVAVAAPEGGA